MKKNALSGLFVIVVAVLIAFNVNLSLNSQKKTLSFCLENVEALAYELPEVEITCGSSEGYCWLTDKKLVGPLLPWYVTYCPRFSGSKNDYCIPGMPA